MNRSQGACQGLVFDLGDVLFDATPWRLWLWRRCDPRARTSFAEFFAPWE